MSPSSQDQVVLAQAAMLERFHAYLRSCQFVVMVAESARIKTGGHAALFRAFVRFAILEFTRDFAKPEKWVPFLKVHGMEGLEFRGETTKWWYSPGRSPIQVFVANVTGVRNVQHVLVTYPTGARIKAPDDPYRYPDALWEMAKMLGVEDFEPIAREEVPCGVAALHLAVPTIASWLVAIK